MINEIKPYKYSVLTYNFGNYEILREIDNPNPDIEYILVTDNNNLKSNTWKIIHFNKFNNPIENTYYVKYHPFDFISTNLLVLIDGSIKIKNDFSFLIEKLNKNDLMLKIHPLRKDIYSEIDAWIYSRNYSNENGNFLKNLLKNSNYEKNGLYEINFLILTRKKSIENLLNLVYSFCKYINPKENISRMDQVIFAYVLNNYFSYLSIYPLTEKILEDNNYLAVCIHNSIEENHNLKKLYPNYVYSKQVWLKNKLVTINE